MLLETNFAARATAVRGHGSNEGEQSLEFEAGIARDASERSGPKPCRVVIREGDLSARGVPVDAMGTALANEFEPCALERSTYPADREIRHAQPATTT